MTGKRGERYKTTGAIIELHRNDQHTDGNKYKSKQTQYLKLKCVRTKQESLKHIVKTNKNSTTDQTQQTILDKQNELMKESINE